MNEKPTWIVLESRSYHMCLIDIVGFSRAAEMYLDWKQSIGRCRIVCVCLYRCVYIYINGINGTQVSWTYRSIQCCVGVDFQVFARFWPTHRWYASIYAMMCVCVNGVGGGRWTRWPLIDLSPIQICRSIEIVWEMVSWQVNVVGDGVSRVCDDNCIFIKWNLIFIDSGS